jgi:predicted DNA-binding protein (MmcQ/YjbR family)
VTARGAPGGYSPRVTALAAFLDAKPGAQGSRVGPNVTMYKVTGKIFAILSMKAGYVVLKTPAESVEILKARYQGVGHKTHLDRRYWIAVTLDADVPPKEAQRLASLSYDLVRATTERPAKQAVKKIVRKVRA